jgi:hypothetical protein
LFQRQAAFAAAHKDLAVRLFMSGAGEESPGYLAQVRWFDERLQSRHYPGLRYKWRLVDGERHSGTKPESYNRAVRLRVRAARRQPERQVGAQPNVSPFQPQR